MKSAPLLAALLAVLPACSDGSGDERIPVVLIVVDTLRADYVQDAQGRVVLPRIAELARDGVVFPRAFVHTSWTLPSHTSLFSSRPPHATGVILNAQRVPADLPLLPEWLSARGYRTEGVVSLCSLIPAGEISRLDRGFEAFDDRMQRVLNPADVALGHVQDAVARCAGDERPFFLFAHFADPHQPYTAHGTVTLPAEVVLGGEVVGSVPNLASFAPFKGTLALAPGENRIEVRAEQPFAVKYADARAGGETLETRFDSAHAARSAEVVIVNPGASAVDAEVELWAWDAPDDAESRRRYALEVAFLDRHVGLLLDDLRARGLYDRALVILTADHGEGLGEHGLIDHGLSCFDELLHVPLIVKLPAGHAGRAALERSAAGLVRQIDVAPTILQALDLPALPGGEGLSLLETGERLLLAETHALVVGDFFALRDERWKLVYAPGAEQFVLFDLAADPDELQPLVELDEQRFGPWMERLRAAAAGAPRAVGVDRDVDPETRARLKAMGYF